MCAPLSEPASPGPSEIILTPFPLEGEGSLPLALAQSWLSADEQERASRFRFPVHRERYIRGRAMLRALLARRLGCSPDELVFTLGERGKPALDGPGPGFNLSHSEGRAVIAIGEMPHLGVDIEGYDRQVDLEGLARRCFRDSEIAWMHAFPPPERHLAFFRIWTAKEARMKASGEGFALEPKRIELHFQDGFPRGLLEPLSPPAYLVPALLPDPDCACCVVALAPFRLRLQEAPSFPD